MVAAAYCIFMAVLWAIGCTSHIKRREPVLALYCFALFAFSIWYLVEVWR